MINLNRANRNAIMSILALIALIFVLGALKNTSKYQPRPITIKAISEESLFGLEHRLECAPGHTSEGRPTPRASLQVSSVVPENWSETTRATRLRMELADL